MLILSLKRALRLFFPIALLLLLWLALGRFGVISPLSYQNFSLWVAFLLFILSLPLALLVRVDILQRLFSIHSHGGLLITAAVIVFFNFLVICVIREALSKYRRKK